MDNTSIIESALNRPNNIPDATRKVDKGPIPSKKLLWECRMCGLRFDQDQKPKKCCGCGNENQDFFVQIPENKNELKAWRNRQPVGSTSKR